MSATYIGRKNELRCKQPNCERIFKRINDPWDAFSFRLAFSIVFSVPRDSIWQPFYSRDRCARFCHERNIVSNRNWWTLFAENQINCSWKEFRFDCNALQWDDTHKKRANPHVRIVTTTATQYIRTYSVNLCHERHYCRASFKCEFSFVLSTENRRNSGNLLLSLSRS